MSQEGHLVPLAVSYKVSRHATAMHLCKILLFRTFDFTTIKVLSYILKNQKTILIQIEGSLAL